MKYLFHYVFAKGYGPIWVWFHDHGITLKGERQVAKSAYYVLKKYKEYLVRKLLLTDKKDIQNNARVRSEFLETFATASKVTESLENIKNEYNF